MHNNIKTHDEYSKHKQNKATKIIPASSALHGVIRSGLDIGASAREPVHAAGHVHQRRATHIVTIDYFCTLVYVSICRETEISQW